MALGAQCGRTGILFPKQGDRRLLGKQSTGPGRHIHGCGMHASQSAISSKSIPLNRRGIRSDSERGLCRTVPARSFRGCRRQLVAGHWMVSFANPGIGGNIPQTDNKCRLWVSFSDNRAWQNSACSDRRRCCRDQSQSAAHPLAPATQSLPGRYDPGSGSAISRSRQGMCCRRSIGVSVS